MRDNPTALRAITAPSFKPATKRVPARSVVEADVALPNEGLAVSASVIVSLQYTFTVAVAPAAINVNTICCAS